MQKSNCPRRLPPASHPAPMRSGVRPSLLCSPGAEFWEAEAQLGCRAWVCHRGLFPLAQAQSWHRTTSWLTCLLFPPSFYASFYKSVYLLAAKDLGSLQTGLKHSQEEEQWERGDPSGHNRVMRKGNLALPTKSFLSLQFMPLCQMPAPCQALPSAMVKYPSGSLVRFRSDVELLPPSVPEPMKGGVTSPAGGGGSWRAPQGR